MKQTLLSLLLLLLPIAASADESGTCGDNLTWTFESATGTLTISGTGEMKDYTYYVSPWKGRSDIIRVIIEDGVTSVGGDAFRGCSGIMSISIPNTVTEIGYEAFFDCSSLTSVTIPSSVSIIGQYAFVCGNLTSVHIEDIAAWCRIRFGSAQANPLFYAGHLYLNDEEITDLVIPTSIKTLDSYAFYGCSGLTSVTIPESVTNIGGWAFYGCSDLKSIVIPDSVTRIPDHAFQNCSSLTSVTIPETMTWIGSEAFYGCSSLEKVYCYAEKVPYAYKGFQYSSTTQLIVPYSSVDNYRNDNNWKSNFSTYNITPILKTIESDGIYYNLIMINQSQTEAHVASNPNGYEGRLEIPKSITYDDSTYSVTGIWNSAFSGDKDLISITIPDSVSVIGNSAFYGCSGLTSVNIPESIASIGDCTFMNCTGLTSVNIPESVMSIGNSAFQGSSGLLNVTIPRSVTAIGNSAFSGCSGLTSVVISDSTMTIGDFAFEDCSGLMNITIPGAVKNIKNGTFKNCKGLIEITISDGVKSIGESAFYGCVKLKNVILPDSITSIGYSAFYACNELETINIPKNVKRIEANTFRGCYNLNNVDIPDSVAYIGSEAFTACYKITSITIPEFVTSIGNHAFYGCRGLKEFNFNAINCTTMGSSNHPVFKECYLPTLNIGKNVKTIPAYAFYGCNRLTSLTIPESVTSIEASAFSICRGLTSVTIPESVKSIGEWAFGGCSGLESLSIPGSVTTIRDNAFADCSGLLTVSLSEGVGIIRQKAFSGCYQLTSVTIPSSVEYIYQEAFAGCSALKQVNVLATTPPFLYDNSFSDYNAPQLKVPVGSIEAYQEAQGWKNFTNVSDGQVYSLTYKVDGEVYKTYEIERGTNITPEEQPTKVGYTFSGWSEIPEKMPGTEVTVSGSFTVNKYLLTYVLDGDTLRADSVDFGSTLVAETIPTKTGYTFSGWNGLLETMPAEDVTATGTFTVNTYSLVYVVDGEIYKTIEVEYGNSIIPEESPTKVGYTFSGWSGFPSSMPAKDVTISGTFTINSYRLTYVVEGENYKSFELEYGSAITPEAEPIKEGYTFNGWSEVPETMPANDVTVSGSFTINRYPVSYMIDGETYVTELLEYGSVIIPPQLEGKTGYSIVWNDYPEVMPANDITIAGHFLINQYKLTYLIDGKEYKVFEMDYDSKVALEDEPTKTGYTFSGWSETPERMPAYDVTVTGSFIVNKYKLTYIVDGEVFKTEYVEYGATISPESLPVREGYVFSEWSEVPETMPAHDVTVYADDITGITNVISQQEIKIIYTPNGKRIEKLQKGLNIVVMNDGTVKKAVKK